MHSDRLLLGQWPAWRDSARPADVPPQPEQTYAGRGWVSWSDWLGTQATSRGDASRAKRAREALSSYEAALSGPVRVRLTVPTDSDGNASVSVVSSGVGLSSEPLPPQSEEPQLSMSILRSFEPVPAAAEESEDEVSVELRRLQGLLEAAEETSAAMAATILSRVRGLLPSGV